MIYFTKYLNMKTIFITGVSSGIGKDALRLLVSQGYLVIGTVRRQEDADKLLDTYGDRVRILVFDVCDQEATNAAIKQISPILDTHGLHALINNAGVAIPGPLQYITDEEFHLQIEINVLAVRRITNALLPYLGTSKVYQPGYIINISSVSGLFNAPFNGAYCISKHALESMTDVYRRELTPVGIRVTAIEPGPVKTEIWRKNKGTLSRFADTPYGHLLSSADTMIENSEKSGYEVAVISQLIVQILGTQKPKTRYLVHRKKFMFTLLSKWLPDRWADKLVARSLAGGKQYRPV